MAGRPNIPRDVARCSWRLIQQGMTSRDAPLVLGVSRPVAEGWFRHSGGMSPLSLTVSGRYLSMAEREEIACARAAGQGVRQIAALPDLFHQRDRKPQRLRDGCWGRRTAM